MDPMDQEQIFLSRFKGALDIAIENVEKRLKRMKAARGLLSYENLNDAEIRNLISILIDEPLANLQDPKTQPQEQQT